MIGVLFHQSSPARRFIGKAHTITIEQDNRNTRHHLGRMTRRIKVVSKKVEMVDMTLKLWCALTQPKIFHDLSTNSDIYL